MIRSLVVKLSFGVKSWELLQLRRRTEDLTDTRLNELRLKGSSRHNKSRVHEARSSVFCVLRQGRKCNVMYNQCNTESPKSRFYWLFPIKNNKSMYLYKAKKRDELMRIWILVELWVPLSLDLIPNCTLREEEGRRHKKLSIIQMRKGKG